MFDLAYKNLAIHRCGAGMARSAVSTACRPICRQRFIGMLDQMRHDLAERNIPLVLSTFIVKYRRDQDRATQIANADVAFYYMPWMSIDGMLDAMDRYNAAIVDYGQRAGVPVIDDRTSIPPDAEHFTDCMHLADKGNEAMAERFYRFFRTSGIVPGTP